MLEVQQALRRLASLGRRRRTSALLTDFVAADPVFRSRIALWVALETDSSLLDSVITRLVKRDPSLAIELRPFLPPETFNLRNAALTILSNALKHARKQRRSPSGETVDILLELAQKHLDVAQLPEASRYGGQALRMSKRLLVEKSTESSARHAEALKRNAIIQAEAGQYREACVTAVEAARLFAQLVDRGAREYLANYAIAMRTLGALFGKAGSRDGSGWALTESARVLLKLDRETAGQWMPDLAYSQLMLGVWAIGFGRFDLAERALDSAIRKYEAWAQRHRFPAEYYLMEARLHWMILKRRLGAVEEAGKLADAVLEDYRKLLREYPEHNLKDYARALSEAGECFIYAGRLPKAWSSIQEAIGIYVTLGNQRRNAYEDELAHCFYHHSTILGRMGNADGALTAGLLAAKRFARLAVKDSHRYDPWLAHAFENTAQALESLGYKKHAAKGWNDIVRLRRRACKADKATHAFALALSLAHQGAFLARNSKRHRALKCYVEANTLFKSLPNIGGPVQRLEYANSLNEHGYLLHRLGMNAKAVVRLRAAQALYSQIGRIPEECGVRFSNCLFLLGSLQMDGADTAIVEGYLVQCFNHASADRRFEQEPIFENAFASLHFLARLQAAGYRLSCNLAELTRAALRMMEESARFREAEAMRLACDAVSEAIHRLGTSEVVEIALELSAEAGRVYHRLKQVHAVQRGILLIIRASLFSRKRHPDAIEVGAEAVAILRKESRKPGFTSWRSLVQALFEQGVRQAEADRTGAAEELFNEAVRTAERTFGGEEIIVAMAKGNLAELYTKAGDWDRAKPYLIAALSTFRATLGEDHAFTRTAKSCLGDFYRQQRKGSGERGE